MEPSTTDWTAGYVADIDYMYGYYADLNPTRIPLALAHAGLHFPAGIETACELGFGQGVSVNFHAAASTVQWWGTDFNPSQAAFAQELTAAAGSGAKLYDQSFADFCARADLPDFDFIALHGIWSWISDENRRHIVDFIRRKLKVGGVLYISYNTMPGWAGFAPMRHLLNEHADIIGAEGLGTVKRIDEALDFATRLLAVNPIYARVNSQVAERLGAMKEQNRQYLAHEYFNRDWHPMHFGTIAKWLAPAKVSFACSAEPLDHVDGINLTNEQQDFLRGIQDLTFRESVRDFIMNRQFRKDYWVKGARKLSTLEQSEQIRSLRFVLNTPAADVPLKVHATGGEMQLSADVYRPLLDAMSNHQPVSIGELEKKLAPHNLALHHVIEAMLVLTGNHHVDPAQQDADVKKSREPSRKLNAAVRRMARHSGDITALPSPVTGGAIGASRFQQLFMSSVASGKKTPEAWAREVAEILALQNQHVVKDGRVLNDSEQADELLSHAKVFQNRIPTLKALDVM